MISLITLLLKVVTHLLHRLVPLSALNIFAICLVIDSQLERRTGKAHLLLSITFIFNSVSVICIQLYLHTIAPVMQSAAQDCKEKCHKVFFSDLRNKHAAAIKTSCKSLGVICLTRGLLPAEVRK